MNNKTSGIQTIKLSSTKIQKFSSNYSADVKKIRKKLQSKENEKKNFWK